MIQHYVLSINPQAEYDWDKYVIRNPITGERPDFTNTIVNNQSGSYLAGCREAPRHNLRFGVG